MRQRTPISKVWLALGGLLVVLLIAAVFTLGSLNVPFQLDRPNEILLLYALSTFMVASLMVFGLVLTRSFLRLWAERRAGQLGSHFKWKMVTGAMAISLLPVVFMFMISYALMNRTLAKWFPRPLEIATQESQELLAELWQSDQQALQELLARAIESTKLEKTDLAKFGVAAAYTFDKGADRAWFVAGGGERYSTGAYENWVVELPANRFRLLRTLPGGGEVWRLDERSYVAARSPLAGGSLYVAKQIPSGVADRLSQIDSQISAYHEQKLSLRTFRNQILLSLGLFTVLLLFSTTWFALFLSKQVTMPIQALAEATHEVAKGNLEYRVEVKARDELGTLVNSFNQMTAQLGDSRKQINEFNNSLQLAIAELDSRRKVMEAILENIPTGVLSLDAAGTILRASPAVAAIFGNGAREARSLAELLGAEAAAGVEQLMRKALRMGTASKEFSIPLAAPAGTAGAGRVLQAAVTVSALGPRRTTSGYVVVIDDLTDLLRAQKAAAWQEVAQRIAHEIKNPLTPIQLSAQRLARHLEKQRSPDAPAGMAVLQKEWESLVSDCAGLIEREVAALKSLVDEFSQFARFPTVKQVPVETNSLITSALEVFAGRLEGVRVRTSFAPDLPTIKADPELLRRVLVNLIDNAAEAMEGASVRELDLITRLDGGGETVEFCVADSGHGISPEDKDKLFLPHFSTRARGTGLGLAIASRIIEEHHGTLRVEDNQPFGARFLVRLPVAEVPVSRS